MAYYEWYGNLVERCQLDIWNNLDEVILGFYEGQPREAAIIVNAAAARLRDNGNTIDPLAVDDILAIVANYDTRRTLRFRERYFTTPYLQNVILLFTVPYPNEVPVKQIKQKPESIRFETEEEILAFFTGGSDEDYA